MTKQYKLNSDESYYYSSPQDTESRLDLHIQSLLKGLAVAEDAEAYHLKRYEAIRDLINRGDAGIVNYDSFDYHTKMCNKYRADLKVIKLMIDSAKREKEM